MGLIQTSSLQLLSLPFTVQWEDKNINWYGTDMHFVLNRAVCPLALKLWTVRQNEMWQMVMQMRKGKCVISEVRDLANGCLQADRALPSR